MGHLPVSATNALIDAITAVRAADDDPARRSRWKVVRNRAERRWWAHEEWAREVAARYRSQLVLEAADRVAGRSQPSRSWHRPDVAAVLEEVRQFGNYLPASPESVAQVIYQDNTLTLNRDDFTLVREHAAGLPDDVFSILQRRSYTAKPGTLGVTGFENDEETIASLASPHTRLPRPVTLYRGEHRQSTHPQFAQAVQEARPGDLLTERTRPVSATIDPSIAASSEFTPGGHLGHERGADATSWLLEITTERLLYAGDRANRSGDSDGLASFEREAVIYVPRLRVTGHREALVRCPHGGLKRLHVIACTPDDETPRPPSARRTQE